MNKPILLIAMLFVGLILLAGCAGTNTPGAPTAGQPPAAAAVNGTNPSGLPPQMANPASVNCINAGGRLRIAKDANGGEVGMCDLANGTTCEEWAFMRGDCPAANSSGPAAGANASGSGAKTGGNGSGSWDNPFFADIPAPATAIPTAAAVGADGVQTLTMTADNFTFTPNTVTAKRGVKVRILATSLDVEHSLAIPGLQINANMPVGKTVTVEFTPEQAGSFPFRCAVFCGSGHRAMTGTLIVTD